jgi:WhiB family transcriptional regulator, redox-sensing transcriptional regulator
LCAFIAQYRIRLLEGGNHGLETSVGLPVGNTGPAITQIEEAKKVCNRCIVKEPCLAWALESGQDAGVWGGLSEDERRALKRRAARNRARLADQANS